MGNTILVNGLLREVPRSTEGISPQAVIRAGPTNFQRLTTDPTVLRALEYSYSQAIQGILYFALAAIAMSLLFAIGMEWKNLKTSIQEEQYKVGPSIDAPRDEHTVPTESTRASIEASDV